jgi:hypothetical protein
MILYHLAVILLSAGIALSLPRIASFMAKSMLIYWSFIENERLFLVALEVGVAILLMSFFHYAGKRWQERKLSRMARQAGMVLSARHRDLFGRRTQKRLMERHGMARSVMILGSTGFRAFADPQADLHRVLPHCRDARILLLNPYSEGAKARAKSILHPEVTPERFREQTRKSIEFLKGLRAARKDIRLKLYPDPPHLKLIVLGDYLWMQHYHPGIDVQSMPVYVFTHNQDPGSLYTPLYQHFMRRWEDPEIPEYDLETDEIVYRDRAGNETTRGPFEDTGPACQGAPPERAR